MKQVLAALVMGLFLVAGGVPAAAQDSKICAESSGDEAISACTRAIDSGRSKGEALATLYYNRGWEFDEKREYERAIRDYDRAIEINAKPNYFTNRGLAYASMEKYDRAIVDYDEAISMDSEHETAWNNRGVAYEKKGQLARALKDFDKAIEIKPDYEKALNNRKRVRDALRNKGS
jgi:tetratricopeptide (TPR) repeat protein